MRHWTSRALTIICVASFLGLTACSNMSRQDQAALSGGAIGGLGGLAVGTLLGGPIVGAMIGGAGGAAYGALKEE